jgi:hypothetical protein
MKSQNLRKISVTEYEPVYCPVLKKGIDPCECYETQMGMSNILESAGVSGDEAWEVCENTCDSLPEFIERSTSYAFINEDGKIVNEAIRTVQIHEAH